MNVIGENIITKRGESFTVGFLITKEYSGYEFPYWTEAGILNPYYLLQVRNSEFYEKDKGSIYNYWIPCKIMTPIDASGFNLLQCHGLPQSSSNENGPTSAKNGDLYYDIQDYEPKFHIKIDYSGAKGHLDVTGTMFKKTFLPIDAKNFRQGNWWYDIFLVSGVTMVDYLRGKYESFFHDRSIDGTIKEMDIYTKREYELYGKSSKWLYDRICSYDPCFRDSVNWEHPLVNYQEVDKLTNPRKFIVR